MRLILCVVCISLVSSIAMAGPPLDGIYKSETIGGPVFEAVGTESWTTPNGWVQPGNVVTMGSFKGNVIGSQWHISCPMITASFLLSNDVDGSGNGNKTYAEMFTGGMFWLSGVGPWGNGDASYQAAIDNYSETIVISYENWVVVGCNMTFSSINGHFEGYPDACFSLMIGDKVCRGNTDTGNKQGFYPDFLDPGCNPTRQYGHWDDVEDLTLTITGCAIPTAPTTWGGIKALHRD